MINTLARRSWMALAAALVASAAHPGLASAGPGDNGAGAILDSALVRMGGAERLRSVERVRFEMVTQWQRLTFDERPSADAPSYELHADLRDYSLGAWRNTRRFPVGANWREMTDVVRDSVAIRRMPGGPGGPASPGAAPAGAWAPLSIAYVDERDELFALAPERVLLAARAAADLRPGADTAVGGVAHARVTATVAGHPATLLVRRTDGWLAAVRLSAAQPNDFGLSPWGEMEVEVWYSGWRRLPDGIVYPFQWDVRRVGRPYKRMTVLAAAFNPPATPDSFAVSDSLRQAYLATARRPMHDLPLDSARLLGPRLAGFGTPGAPVGAVRMGQRWVLLETGQASLNARRASAWLDGAERDTEVGAAVITLPSSPGGGAAWLAERTMPVYVAPGAERSAAAALRGNGVSNAGALTVVREGRWLSVAGDSMWVEPLDLPDAPGAMLVYVPSLAWAYSGVAANPLYRDVLLSRIRQRGWPVTHIGSPAGLLVPLASAR